MSDNTIYRTSDWKEFSSRLEAEWHQEELDKEAAKEKAENELQDRLYAAGSECAKKGDWKGALHWFSQLRSYQSMCYNSGTVYLKMGEWDKAIDVFSKAISNGQAYRADEEFALVSLTGRGGAWWQKGNKEKAVADYKQAYELGERKYSPGQLSKISDYFVKAKDLDKAIDILTVLIRHAHASDQTDYLLKRADLLVKNGETENAIDDWKAAADIAGDTKVTTTALNALASKGVQYTPVTKEQYFAAVKRGDKNALETIKHRGWETDYQDYLTGLKKARLAPWKRAFTFPRKLTAKSVLLALGLGVVCAFLSLIPIGLGVAHLIGNPDLTVSPKGAVFWIWLVAVTLLFAYFWLKRKWLWVALIALVALAGLYIMLGAPGLS